MGLPGLTTPRIVRALLAPAVQQIIELQRWGHCRHMSMLCCVRLYALSRTGLSFHTQCKCLMTCGMIKLRKISLFFFFSLSGVTRRKKPKYAFSMVQASNKLCQLTGYSLCICTCIYSIRYG